MTKMLFFIYNLLWILFLLAGAPFLLLYGLLTGRQLGAIRQRFGSIPSAGQSRAAGPRLWFHAASVGEVQVARALISEVDRLLPQADIVVTTVTQQGYEVARQQLADKALCLYAPVDLIWPVKRFLTILQPDVYICLETELWPNMIWQAAQADVKMLILNGRLSANSFGNYRKFRWFTHKILECFSGISAIEPHDCQRFVALGADPGKVEVNGNAKYDLGLASQAMQNQGNEQPETSRTYRQRLALTPAHRVLVAGSIHSGEGEFLLDVFTALRQECQDLILILAPRHLHRVERFAELIRGHYGPEERLSQLKDGERRSDIILIDTMGELTNIYSVATYVFCGGSLVDKGGHNIMEPAMHGRPPFYGPSMQDFQDACRLLENGEAGFPVKNHQELIESIRFFECNPQKYEEACRRAAAIAGAQQGSARRQIELLKKLLLTESVKL